MVVVVVLPPPPQAGIERARQASNTSKPGSGAGLEWTIPWCCAARRTGRSIVNAANDTNPISHHVESGQLPGDGSFGQRGGTFERAVVDTVTTMGWEATPKPTGTELGLTLQVAAVGAPVQASETLPLRFPTGPAESL